MRSPPGPSLITNDLQCRFSESEGVLLPHIKCAPSGGAASSESPTLPVDIRRVCKRSQVRSSSMLRNQQRAPPPSCPSLGLSASRSLLLPLRSPQQSPSPMWSAATGARRGPGAWLRPAPGGCFGADGAKRSAPPPHAASLCVSPGFRRSKGIRCFGGPRGV